MLGTSAERERGVIGNKACEIMYRYFPPSNFSQEYSGLYLRKKKVYGARAMPLKSVVFLFSPDVCVSNKNIGDKQISHFAIIERLRLSMT